MTRGSGADLERAVHDYAEVARRYDRATRRIEAIRTRAIDALGLLPGDVVLDAGCGTGWCIPRLAHAVGANGLVIGFDPSAAMLAIARDRLRGAGVRNAMLLEAAAESVVLPRAPDAILFSYTHDLLQTPSALARVLRQARPGARVAACGTKRFPLWLAPLVVYQRYSHRRYITDFSGLARPWSPLVAYLERVTVATEFPGNRYLAHGRLRAGVGGAASASDIAPP